MAAPQYLHPGQHTHSGASSPAPSGSSASSHYGFERYPSSPSLTSGSEHSPYPSPGLAAASHGKHPQSRPPPAAPNGYFDQTPRYPQPQVSQAQYQPYRAAPAGPGHGGPVFANQHLQPRVSSRAAPPPAPIFAQQAHGHHAHHAQHHHVQQQHVHQRADSDEMEQLRPAKPTWRPRTSSRGAHMHVPVQARGAHAPPLPPMPVSPAASSFSAHSASTTFTFPTPSPSLPPTPSSATFPRNQQQQTAAPAPVPAPAAAVASLGPPFDLADWTSPSLPDVVSPSLYLAWQESPLANRRQSETVFVDAQARRVVFVAREYRRGRDGVLRREADGGAAAEDGILWPEWHDGLGAAEGAEAGQARNDAEGVEWLLLEVPTAKQRERGSDQLKKIGLVTEETLFLQQGRKIRWGKFYRRAIFGNGEPTWKGVGGGKYRWAKSKDAGCYKLVDDKTKEVVVSVRERDNKPTQLVLSALILPSIQPVVLTLLHRSYAIAKKALASDQRVWEEEEVVAW
ncbi:hypothetical protein JCM10449v2_000040 [Rhodotorula kratochvilovae]